MNKKILEIQNLSFSYENEKTTLNNINFTINEGDFASIVGRNGGGKTTLIKIILNLIKINKRAKYIKTNTKKISFVPQEAPTLKNFPCTVFEIIRTGLMSTKKLFYNKKDKELVKNIAKEFDIESLLNKQFKLLSGGEKQKVLILRAIISKPDFLILDEATANMDKNSENMFFEHIKEKVLTVLMISHNINTVSKYINKVICIDSSAVTHKISETNNEDYNIIVHKHCGMHSGE